VSCAGPVAASGFAGGRGESHLGRSCTRAWGQVYCSDWVLPRTHTYFSPFPARNGGSYTGTRDLRASPGRRVGPELRAASSRAPAPFRVSRALLSRAATAGVSRPVARPSVAGHQSGRSAVLARAGAVARPRALAFRHLAGLCAESCCARAAWRRRRQGRRIAPGTFDARAVRLQHRGAFRIAAVLRAAILINSSRPRGRNRTQRFLQR